MPSTTSAARRFTARMNSGTRTRPSCCCRSRALPRPAHRPRAHAFPVRRRCGCAEQGSFSAFAPRCRFVLMFICPSPPTLCPFLPSLPHRLQFGRLPCESRVPPASLASPDDVAPGTGSCARGPEQSYCSAAAAAAPLRASASSRSSSLKVPVAPALICCRMTDTARCAGEVRRRRRRGRALTCQVEL